MFKEAFTLLNDREDPASLGYVYAKSGERREALKLVAVLEEQSKQKYVRQEYIARIYAALGDLDQAFRWLERAHEAHSVNMPYLKVSPEWNTLRPDARFQSILARMKFPK